jgi:hypothetical protein
MHILQMGDELMDRVEQTRDISSGGVCFVSPRKVDVGGRIEYIITLAGSTPPVRIRCLGKVLRSESAEATGLYEVAVTMERYSFVRTDEPAPIPVCA